ncbi:MAG: cobalt ECF transporter T component CbiQ [Desulfatitalea sp.]|nr:cobalt ECF transporter T component CbiQ [Desulfatitalea sp.]
MVDADIIGLPLWYLPALVIVPMIVLVAAIKRLSRFAHTRSTPGEAPDWSVPPVDTAAGSTLFHRWDVRCKLITILVYSFMITALTQVTMALAALGLSCLALVAARASPTRVLLRLLAIAGFVSMFLVIMPFTAPVRVGDTVIVFGRLDWLGFNLRGLVLAVTITIKAVAITLLMEPLLATAPLPVTLHGLAKLGVPEMIGQMLLLSYRYLHVFRHEARRMAAGMQVRGFRKRTDLATLKAVANFLGMLFVRSFERTERVFDAMRARGYRGRFPEPVELRLKRRDVILAGGWLVLGIALIFLDRLAWQG